MSNITIKLGGKEVSCRVEINHGAADKVRSIVKDHGYTSAFVITDKNLVRHHKSYFDQITARRSSISEMLVLPSGESIKNNRTQMRIHKWLLNNGAGRGSILIGVGGGVVCDIVGFAAATFMRGIDHLLIPTTLLAQVDAAIGGKNGINLADTKNMIGTVKQPMSILVDPRFLTTLSRANINEGLSELLKMAFIKSRKLRSLFSHYHDSNDQTILMKMITEGIRSKLDIVKKDQFEAGLRMILNFGHTTAHALEVQAGYKRSMSHGKAVAAGMLVALELSRKRCSLDENALQWGSEQIAQLYKNFPMDSYAIDEIWDVIGRDKKKTGAGINFVLLESMYYPIVRPVNKRDFKSAYNTVARKWSSAR